MQLYGEPKKQLVDSRQWGADSDDSDGYYPESGSEGSSDSERERVVKNGCNRHAPLHDSNKPSFCSNINQQNSPYMRQEPLSQKISSLEREFPILKSVRSFGLSP